MQTVTTEIEITRTVTVKGTFFKGCRETYDPPQPAESDSMEDITAYTEDGKTMDLTQEEEEQAMHALFEQHAEDEGPQD